MIDVVILILVCLLVALSVSILIAMLKHRFKTPVNNPDLSQALKDNRSELRDSLKASTDSINQQFSNIGHTLRQSLKELRQDNHAQLDRMRNTVDEKLQSTLEKRLTASFKQVTEQLEAVNKNFGEMQALASNVGDLQNTLSGVKTRGIWGEAHLSNLLAEILNPEQYETEFKTNPQTNHKVDFALKIPSADDQVLYLPVDAKFPLTKFEKLQTAMTNKHATDNKKDISKAQNALKAAIKDQAKKINKYINPPLTTDFAIMYLPLESLYAEIAQNTDLVEELRDKFKVSVVGPSTILPMLAMLNLGYRSLMIQKNVAQVWQVLRETQAEFANFGGLMDKARKKLTEVSSTIEDASTKTRTIESKFKKVHQIDNPN